MTSKPKTESAPTEQFGEPWHAEYRQVDKAGYRTFNLKRADGNSIGVIECDTRFESGDRDIDRINLCVNACASLTDEQIKGIPGYVKALNALESWSRLTPDEMADIPAKLAAFDAMREALVLSRDLIIILLPEIRAALKLVEDPRNGVESHP